jgi:uncharacterized membrane protein
MNGNRNAEWLARAVIVAMFVLATLTWPSAPAQIPIHWNIAGQINGYGPKLVGLFLMPIIALAGYIFIGAVAVMRPEQFEGSVMSALSWLRLAYVLLTAGVFGVIVADVRGANLLVNYAIFPLFVLMAIAMGNLIVRSIQLEKAKKTPPGGGIRV